VPLSAPALAIILAVAVDKTPGREWWLAASMLLLVLLPAIGDALPDAFLDGATKAHWAFNSAGVPFAMAVAIVWWLARRGRLVEAMLASAAALALVTGYLKLTILLRMEQRDSARAFSRAHGPQIAEACVDANLSRTWVYGIEYYAGRSLPECGGGTGANWQIRIKEGGLVLEPGL